jgi:hypothetical protein
VRSPFLKVLAAQPDRHDVECFDVAEVLAGLGERVLDRSIRTLRGSANDLDDLGDAHAISPHMLL